jgi:hypothetical protein
MSDYGLRDWDDINSSYAADQATLDAQHDDGMTPDEFWAGLARVQLERGEAAVNQILENLHPDDIAVLNADLDTRELDEDDGLFGDDLDDESIDEYIAQRVTDEDDEDLLPEEEEFQAANYNSELQRLQEQHPTVHLDPKHFHIEV